MPLKFYTVRLRSSFEFIENYDKRRVKIEVAKIEAYKERFNGSAYHIIIAVSSMYPIK